MRTISKRVQNLEKQLGTASLMPIGANGIYGKEHPLWTAKSILAWTWIRQPFR
jgi:hypothetical protein